MKIKRLILENFMAIKTARIDLDDKGLVLIQGENRDDPSASSNGAGKSSTVDGVMFALFGETARGVSGDDVINDLAGKDCRAVLTVEDDGKEYIISRHRKHKEGKNALWLFRDKNDITKGTNKLTQAAIETVIGCSSDVFKAAIYAGQEAMPDLPGMTDRHLKQLVEEAAGIDKLEAAYKVSRDDMNSLKSMVEVGKTRIEGSGTALKAGMVEVKRLKTEIADWSTKRDERLEVAKSIADEAKDSSESLKKSLDKFNETELSDKLNAIRSKIDSVGSEQLKLDELRAADAKIGKLNSKAESELNQAKRDLISAKKRVDDVHELEGKPCDECGQAHTKDTLSGTVVTLQDRLLKIKEVAKSAVTAMKSAKESSEKSAKSIADHIASMTCLKSERSAEAEILAEMDSLKEASRLHKNSERVLAEKQDKCDEISKEANPYESLAQSKLKELKELKASLDELKGRVEIEEADFNVAKDVVDVFGPSGVRAHILDTVTPFLNERTSHYLGILSDGSMSAEWSTLSKTRKGEMTEKFNIAVTNIKGAKTFQGLSGGEKRKVRISTAMALQDLVAARATKPIDLFIGDEIDDALDSAGLERLMSILEVKARERGTVLLISHNDLKDWVRNSMTVIKEGGVSTIEGAA